MNDSRKKIMLNHYKSRKFVGRKKRGMKNNEWFYTIYAKTPIRLENVLEEGRVALKAQ